MRYEGACTFKSISSFLYNKKECALAHSRALGAERLLSYGNEVSYTIKMNPAKQDSPPAAGRASDILPFRCSAIHAERLLSYGNEVSIR